MHWPSNLYIYPPRPSNSIPFDQCGTYEKQGFKAQLKYNDTRVIIYIGENLFKIWNRHKKPLNYEPPPNVKETLQKLAAVVGAKPYCILDGGLIHFKHEAVKNTFAIWDVLVKNGEYLLGTTYHDRYHLLPKGRQPAIFGKGEKLLEVGKEIGPGVIIPEMLEFPLNSWWEALQNLNSQYNSPLIEGFVLKHPTGKLGPGAKEENNGSWMTRCRVKTGRHVF